MLIKMNSEKVKKELALPPLRTLREMVPCTSRFCRPPSLPAVNKIFSSWRRCTLWAGINLYSAPFAYNELNGRVIDGGKERKSEVLMGFFG